MKHSYSIEDCLEFLVGHSIVPGLHWKDKPFNLYNENRKVLYSIGTQVFKGKALTDKQHELVKSLLVEWYSDQFKAVGINIDHHVDILRSEYRVVDKSHWVKKTTSEGNTYISIRFPFSNNAIDHIAKIKSLTSDRLTHKEDYVYKDHIHSFRYNEINVYKIVNIANSFDNKPFEFDEEVIQDYNDIKKFDTNKDEYVPGIYNLEYKNIPTTLESHLTKLYGKPSESNIVELWDKRRLYGLHSFDTIDISNYSTLSNKILERQVANIQIRSDVWTLEQLFESIRELNRFPLLVLINEDYASDELSMFWNVVKGFIDNNEVSVTFRLDNKNNEEFNQFIRDKGLNNSVTNKTKIVVANRKKISKPVIKSEWTPTCMLTFGTSRIPNHIVNIYMESFDLKFFYIKEDSLISSTMRSRLRKYDEGIITI